MPDLDRSPIIGLSSFTTNEKVLLFCFVLLQNHGENIFWKVYKRRRDNSQKGTSDFKFSTEKKEPPPKLYDERKEQWYWCVDENESIIIEISENILLLKEIIRAKIWRWSGGGVQAL